ncbi:MAG: NAD(P)/FAD-dependent oxidoreductase [bacterium]
MDFDYDVVIIGAGIGGLTTGALLGNRGLRVAIFEQGEKAGGCCQSFKRENLTFDAGAHISWGFENAGSHDKVLSDLHLALQGIKLDPLYQVILPNHRLDIFDAYDKFLAEVGREFPSEIHIIDVFSTKLKELEEFFYNLTLDKFAIPPKGLSNKFEHLKFFLQNLRKSSYVKKVTNELLTKINISSEVKTMLDAQVFYFTQKNLTDSPALLASFFLSLRKHGLYYIQGTTQALVSILLRSLNKNNVKIFYKSKVKEIIFKNKKAIGLKINDITDVSSRYIISNTTLWDLYGYLIKPEIQKPGLKRLLLNHPPEWAPISLYLGVEEGILPSPINEHLFIIKDYNCPLFDTNLAFISISPKWDNIRAPNGKRAITATCLLPIKKWEEELSNTNYTTLKEKKTNEMINTLESVITFLKEGIVFKDLATPSTFNRYTLRKQGVIGGIEQLTTDFKRKYLSNYTPYKNVFVVGDNTLPGKGTSFVSQSALNLADIITRLEKK